MEDTIAYPHTTAGLFIPANPLLTPFDPITFLSDGCRVGRKKNNAHDKAKNWILLIKSEKEKENESKIESFIA